MNVHFSEDPYYCYILLHIYLRPHYLMAKEQIEILLDSYLLAFQVCNAVAHQPPPCQGCSYLHPIRLCNFPTKSFPNYTLSVSLTHVYQLLGV